MRVVVREAAYADLQRIHTAIAQDRPAAADGVLARIIASFDRLASFPSMGRPGAVAGTREWVVRGLPYIVVYRIEARLEELDIIAIFHGAQDRVQPPKRAPR